jgi:hypothetical protein
MAVAPGGCHESLHLGLGQVLPGPQLGVGGPLGVTVRFTVVEISAVGPNTHFSDTGRLRLAKYGVSFARL